MFCLYSTTNCFFLKKTQIWTTRSYSKSSCNWKCYCRLYSCILVTVVERQLKYYMLHSLPLELTVYAHTKTLRWWTRWSCSGLRSWPSRSNRSFGSTVLSHLITCGRLKFLIVEWITSRESVSAVMLADSPILKLRQENNLIISKPIIVIPTPGQHIPTSAKRGWVSQLNWR